MHFGLDSVKISIRMKSECSVRTVQRQTEDALAFVKVTAAAYREGVPGRMELYADAEQSYAILLHNICNLTDEEADVIEPIFTKFESEFNALSRTIYAADDLAL